MLLYDAKTNVFAVATADGKPRTMFKPRTGAAYWAEQKAKARAAWSVTGAAGDAKIWFEIAEEHGVTEFLGYDTEEAEGKIYITFADGRIYLATARPVREGVTAEAVAVLQKADAIYLEEIRAAGLYDKI